MPVILTHDSSQTSWFSKKFCPPDRQTQWRSSIVRFADIRLTTDITTRHRCLVILTNWTHTRHLTGQKGPSNWCKAHHRHDDSAQLSDNSDTDLMAGNWPKLLILFLRIYHSLIVTQQKLFVIRKQRLLCLFNILPPDCFWKCIYPLDTVQLFFPNDISAPIMMKWFLY